MSSANDTSEIIGLEEEDERAALIEEILTLSSAMLEALRGGYTEHAAKLICNMLLPYTSADAISVTDKEKVLAYVGFLEEDYPTGCNIRSKATRSVLKTGRAKTILNEDEIGFTQAKHVINAAIIEPLVVARRAVGVMKFYFKDPNKVTKSQRMIVKGFSHLISTQIQAQETENQRRLNAQMEVKMLQSQINPHFLFNTINAIMSLTRTNPDQARVMLQDFAGFYRATLEQDQESISLADEIKNTERYASLQQMRFGEDRLTFETIDKTQGLDNFQIPPFVLQPIVENSIVHAMPTSGQLKVEIEVEQKRKQLHIKVKDNGRGMKKETADNLFASKKVETEGLGLAMKNVHSRIKGFYGRRANIIVKSKRFVGTTTTFVLPISEQTTELASD